ncbi:MAG: helix-turn-helix domain-containing protein [Anaerolineae bacterium]|nr:helix-turn-helix domain-containing protein [Anaerolineae bacterium]
MAKSSLTVGEELRRYRTRRGISQFDMAVCMEWKGTNPLIQIEKNRRIPRPETIERLGKCLGLNYLEIHYLNGLAGYHLPTRLPPVDYVVHTLNQIAEAVRDYPYPAYVVDYQFRFWMANPATVLFTLGDAARLRQLMARPLHAFDITFDSRLGMRGHIQELETFEQGQIFRFKMSNAFRQHENFFRAFPESMDYLDNADYQAFRKVWLTIDVNQANVIEPLQIQAFYSRLKQGDIALRFDEGTAAYYIRVESILHLGDLLQLVTFVPVEESFAIRLNQTYIPADSPTLKVWELLDIGQFYS